MMLRPRLFDLITGLVGHIRKPAGDSDVLIVATAMVHGCTLIACSPIHFRHIGHLMVEAH
jgi:hypothetical protein